MNSLKIKGNWGKLIGRVKEILTNQTENDFLFSEAREEELYRLRQKKHEKTREILRNIMLKA